MPSITKVTNNAEQQKFSKDNFHVLVIGAGTTGLLLAQGLKKNGISFSVYERSDSDTYTNRQRDWTMALHWGSECLHACLPKYLSDELLYVQPDPWIELSDELEHTFPMIEGSTGEVALARNERTTRRASREKLRKLLARDIDVQHGKKLTTLQHDNDTDKVTAIFDDGTTAVGDVVIGCDSVNSRVRRYLLGDEKSELDTLPVIPYNFTCYYTKEQAEYIRSTGHPLIKSGVHKEQNSLYMISAMDIKDPNDPTTWKFQHFMNLWAPGVEPLKTSEERLAHFKSLAGNYAEPFRSAALWVPDDTVVPADHIRHWTKITKWPNHSGRISLAGDAAHAMSPYRGQGMNNGLLDAYNYLQAILKTLNGESSLHDAVDTFDEEILRRGASDIRTSVIQGYSSMHWPLLLNSPVAHHGFRKIDYTKDSVAELMMFQSGVKVPDTPAQPPVEVKV